MSMRHRRHGLSTKVGDLLADAGEGIVIAVGRTVPGSGTKGFAKGCLWVQPGATGTTDVWYINSGSKSSATFSVLPSQTELAGTFQQSYNGGPTITLSWQLTSDADLNQDGIPDP